MIFTAPIFFVFFAVVFAASWLERSPARRKLWLLIASYVFYGAWDWRFLSLIAAATLWDFWIGLELGETGDPRRRRRWITASVIGSLGLLAVFKYANFFLGSAVALLARVGLEAHEPTLAIVLPVGISFFTFQSMSYTLDVYRGRLAPTRSLLDFALFIAFFPQLVAGPIVRAADFLPQLATFPRLAAVPWRSALTLFLVGFVKKACIADRVAPVVDSVFAAPETFGVLAAWTAVLLYAVQIYCDFSGYTDMAIGCARLLGYELCLNFSFPYLARNITEFWRRWHISLSTWLRDCLYISLGGSRGPLLFTYRNLLLTMLLGGLWHGAAWTFVAWGGLHGLALIAHREWRRRAGERRVLPPALSAALGGAATFYLVGFAWIFFRAETFTDAATLARAYLLFTASGGEAVPLAWLALFAALAAAHVAASRGAVTRFAELTPSWLFAAAYGLFWALAIAFVPLRAEPFIYFQF